MLFNCARKKVFLVLTGTICGAKLKTEVSLG